MFALRFALRSTGFAAGLLALSVLGGQAEAQPAGTAFDINVEASTGETRVVNYTGITRICRRDDADAYDPNDPERLLPRCVDTQSPCGVSVVRQEKGIQEYKNPGDRNRELNWYFDWVDDQSNLLADFQVDTTICGDTSLPDPTYIPSTPSKPQPASDG